MALPFQKRRKEAAIVTEMQRPDGSMEEQGDISESADDQEDAGLEACAQDLLSAMENKDIKAMAAAMRAAFEILEAEPHEEAAHEAMLEEPRE